MIDRLGEALIELINMVIIVVGVLGILGVVLAAVFFFVIASIFFREWKRW